MIDLDNFESQVPGHIQSRGLDYHRRKAVLSLVESKAGLWEAIVAGSEEYEVSVFLSGRQVKHWNCDCPYDGGSVCKHIIAVLHALREELASLPKEEKASLSGIEDVLRRHSQDELRDFIRHHASQDRAFGEQLLHYFARKDPKVDMEKIYRDKVQHLVGLIVGRRGFMDYESTYSFSIAMWPLLEEADNAFAAGSFLEAIAIALAVCEAAIGIIPDCDDSSANVSEILNAGIQVLQRLADSAAVGKDLQQRLFDWLERQLEDGEWFDYGEFDDSLLEVAASIGAKLDHDRYLRLMDLLLATSQADSYHEIYRKEQHTLRKIRFLQEIGRDQVAAQLIAANMHITALRLGMVEQSIGQEDFTRAKELIAEGINIAMEKEHAGTVRKWEEVLLRIAELEGDIPVKRFFAKRFALDRGLDSRYYQIWKSSFPADEWEKVIEEHVQSVISMTDSEAAGRPGPAKQRSLFSRLSAIYIAESWWARLLQLMPQDADESVLQAVHPYLSGPYPQEMLAHYLRLLGKMGEQANNRKDYVQLASLMLKVKRDVKDSRVAIEELAVSLMQMFPRRPAMREELAVVLK